MAWMSIKENILREAKKHRYLVMLLLVGLMLLQIPAKDSRKPEEATKENITGTDLRQEMEETLSLIKGAGKVSVMITQKQGEEIIYQTDDALSVNGEVNRKTLILSGEDRSEMGLVRQINPPILQGVLIVCQGGDDPQVKYAIVDAVMRLTGLSSNRICVLKMK